VPTGVPGTNVKDKVIIPKITNSNYPVVPASTAINTIKIKPGAELGRQDLLTYDKAFVQYDFSGAASRDRWHMLSVPLQEAYPGDFAFGGYPKTWVRQFTVSNVNGVLHSSWETSQASTTPFGVGSGFIIWLEAEQHGSDNRGLERSGGILELPFFDNPSVHSEVHHTHDYVSGVNGDIVGVTTVYNHKVGSGAYAYDRNPDQTYKIYRKKSAYKLAGASVNETLTFAQHATGYTPDFALVGNPYMASLDFDLLQAANATKIKPNYQVWTGKGEGAGYSGYNSEGAFGIVVSNTLNKYIAPLQAFIVEKAVGYDAGGLAFNISMTATGAGSLRSPANNTDKLDIVASNEVAAVRTFIAKREGGQDEFGNLDSRKLLNSISNVPEIYTLKPSGNNQVSVGANIIHNDNLLIPVGLATSYTGDITFTFTGMDTYQATINLLDLAENKEMDLTGLSSYEYVFRHEPVQQDGQTQSSEDRFFIRFAPAAPTTPTGLSGVVSESVVVYNKEGRVHVVSGTSNRLKQVSVYNLQGALQQVAHAINSPSYTTRQLASGIYIVKIVSEQSTQNVKLIVK
jgi:hypothetical protein